MNTILDIYKEENKRMQKALEEIIEESPNPKLPYSLRIVALAKQGLGINKETEK